MCLDRKSKYRMGHVRSVGTQGVQHSDEQNDYILIRNVHVECMHEEEVENTRKSLCKRERERETEGCVTINLLLLHVLLLSLLCNNESIHRCACTWRCVSHTHTHVCLLPPPKVVSPILSSFPSFTHLTSWTRLHRFQPMLLLAMP